MIKIRTENDIKTGRSFFLNMVQSEKSFFQYIEKKKEKNLKKVTHEEIRISPTGVSNFGPKG